MLEVSVLALKDRSFLQIHESKQEEQIPFTQAVLKKNIMNITQTEIFNQRTSEKSDHPKQFLFVFA